MILPRWPALAALGLLLVRPAHGYRPFDSTDANVVDPGIVEIELGPLAYEHGPAADVRTIPEATVNVGLSPRWEAVLEGARTVESARDERHDTFESAVLLKGVLRNGILQGRRGPSLAAEFGLLLPTRNEQDDYGVTAQMIRSTLTSHVLFHLNGALTWNRDGAAELFSGLILEPSVQHAVRPVAELNIEHDYGAHVSTWAALIGLIWKRADLSFDLGLRAARTHEWAYEGRIGVTWAFDLANR